MGFNMTSLGRNQAPFSVRDQFERECRISTSLLGHIHGTKADPLSSTEAGIQGTEYALFATLLLQDSLLFLAVSDDEDPALRVEWGRCSKRIGQYAVIKSELELTLLHIKFPF